MVKHKPNQDDHTDVPQPFSTPGHGDAADALTEREAAAEEAAMLDQLRADLEGAKDRVLRSQAELENYRKRAAREIEDHRRYANLPLLRDLLPVLDNIERAVSAADKTHDTASLLEGIKMVLQQLENVLSRYHCQRIAALHQPFDPHLHEAISQQPSDEFPSQTVLLVVQPGYQLFDRVVRPSQVIISTTNNPEPEEAE